MLADGLCQVWDSSGLLWQPMGWRETPCALIQEPHARSHACQFCDSGRADAPELSFLAPPALVFTQWRHSDFTVADSSYEDAVALADTGG